MLYGRNDKPSTAQRCELAQQMFPKLRLSLLDGCSHMVHWDQQAEFERQAIAFAIGLARILVERRAHAAALSALDGAAGAAANNPEFHVLRGGVLQRLARHREAVEAYQSSVRIQAASPQAWIGMGISFDALAQRPEAVDAFRRSLAAGPLSAELKSFAEQRVRALQ